MHIIKKLGLGALVALIVAVVLSIVLGGGVASAARLITGHDIKNGTVTTSDVHDGSLTGNDVHNGTIKGKDIAAWTIKAYNLSPEVLGQISELQVQVEVLQNELAELKGKAPAKDGKDGTNGADGKDGGVAGVQTNWVAKDGAQIVDASSVKLTNAGTPAGSSVEIEDLNLSVQATKKVQFTYALENGAVYGAGSPRVFLEINGDFVNTFDTDPSDAGVDNGDGTFTKTYTITKNGHVASAGVVMDSGAGSITVSTLKVSGKTLLFK